MPYLFLPLFSDRVELEAAWEMAKQPWSMSKRKEEVVGVGERKALSVSSSPSPSVAMPRAQIPGQRKLPR